MQIVINNERRPTKEGLYFTIDTVGAKYITRFRDGNWQSQTGHPVEKWLDDSESSFTLLDMERVWVAGVMAERNDTGTFIYYMKEKYNIDITKQ